MRESLQTESNTGKKLSLEEIKAEIEKRKAQIKEIAKSKDGYKIFDKRNGGTSVEEKPFSKEKETLRLEEEIRELERGYKNFSAEEAEREKKLEVKEEIEKIKARLNELNKADTDGRLSIYYKYSGYDKDNLEEGNYVDMARRERIELEKRIHELEDSMKPKKVSETSEEKPKDEKTPPEKETEGEPKTPKDEKKEDSPLAKKLRKLGVISTDSIEKRSRDIAAERMTADKDSLKGVSGFFKKIWKHNWMAEYYRSKETDKVKKELGMAGSAFSPDDIDGTKDRKIKEDVLRRFLNDAPDLIHADAGEWKKTESDERKSQAEARIKEAIQKYASAIDPAQAELDFKAERDRIYSEMFAEKDGSFNALNVADNVFDFAKEIRGQVEHGKALADLDLDFELTFGEAKTGVRTEAHYSWSEKMIQKISSSPAGRFMNETTIAAGVSFVAMLSRMGTGRGARAAIGLAGGVVVAGGIAGLRESQAIERDRVEHARAMASGKEYDPSRSPRREELKSAMYEMIGAKGVTDALHGMLYEVVDGVEKERNLSQEDIDQIMLRLAQVDSRISLSNKGKLDLLSYSDEALIETERTNLDLERSHAKILLREAFAKNPSLGSFDDKLKLMVGASEIELTSGEGGIEERNSAFKKIKRQHVSKAVAKGVITGLTFGLGAQEVGALWNGQQGIVEGFGASGTGADHLATRVTSLEWAREKLWDSFGLKHELAQGEIVTIPGKEAVYSDVMAGVKHTIHDSMNSSIRLPKDFELNPSGNNPGSYDVVSHGKLITHIETDVKTGNLTPQSLDNLQKAGFAVNTSIDDTLTSTTTEVPVSKTFNVQDYAHEHADKFAKIKRLGWSNEGHLKPKGNELGLGDPIEKNGKYEFSVRMNHGDSIFNGEHIDPNKLAAAGKLKALFSLSKDSQGHPVEVPVNYANGKVSFNVDPKDPILGQFFHKGPNGNIICDAKYIEVGAQMGEHNGVKEFVMCATQEGKGVSGVIGQTTEVKVDDYLGSTVKNNIDWVRGPEVDLPPVIPLVPRMPLEPTKEKKDIISPYYGGGYEGTKEDAERWDKEKSATLAKDPKAKLNQEKEIDLYFEKQKKDTEFGEKYLKKLDERVENSKIGSVLNNETKVVVCIAVHGVSEAENIYKTLELYAKQDKDSLKKSAFVLNINWRELENKSESIKKTIAEVERAKKDFPQLKLAYFTEEMSQELMSRKNNKIHSLIMKNLNDTVLRGIQKNNLKENIYLISNDADCRGMSSKYLKEVIDTTVEEPEKDAFLGKIEWGSEVYNKYPGYHVSMRIMQYLNSVRRNRKSTKERYVESSGANFTCKASTFAAVGGYESNIGAGADRDLGRKIIHARLSGDNSSDEKSYPVSYVNSAWLDTDPQRGLGNYLAGIPMATMWQDFDKSGYKPRTELAVPAGSEESLEKFDDVVKRVEFQINEFINRWNYEEYAYLKALNYLFPRQKGKPGWINKGTSQKPVIVLTEEGKNWLKKQLEDYTKNDRSNIKYKAGRGIKS